MGREHHRDIHVLQVVHCMGLGGVERVVRDLARHFNGGGFRSSVWCLDSVGEFGQELMAHGINVQLLARRPGIDMSLVRRMRRRYYEQGIDVIHAHQYTPYFYAATACLLRPSLRVVFTEHGREHPDRLRPKRAVYNQILRMVTSSYTAVSEFTRHSMATFERIPYSKIRVIYNTLDPTPPKTCPGQARNMMGLDPGVPVILTIGRMDRAKDFATLIRALPAVTAVHSDAVLLVVGGGDPAYLGELTDLVGRLGLTSRVHFLGSRLDTDRLLAACDVFALTSVTEAASMAILEAMRAGRPVVATDVGGNRELVVSESTGLLVPVGDPTRVSEALLRLLRDRERACRMGTAGAQRVAAMFSKASAFEEYRRMYCAAIEC